MSVFKDQKKFMDACGQGVSDENAELYSKLISEEYQELQSALWSFFSYKHITPESRIDLESKVVDGALDLIYVCSGLMHAMGLDPQPLWDEVQASNMSKTQVVDGKPVVIKRDDGKVLKPDWYFKPDLRRLVAMQRGVP